MTRELWALVIAAALVAGGLGYAWWAHRALDRTDGRGRA